MFSKWSHSALYFLCGFVRNLSFQQDTIEVVLIEVLKNTVPIICVFIFMFHNLYSFFDYTLQYGLIC